MLLLIGKIKQKAEKSYEEVKSGFLKEFLSRLVIKMIMKAS